MTRRLRQLAGVALSDDSAERVRRNHHDAISELQALVLKGPPIFTATAQGEVPASGGGAAKFLRADASWQVPSGGGGALSDGDYGDITVSGSGTAMSIDAAAVTLAKLASIAAARILGSIAGGTPAALTATQVTALLDIFTSTLQGLVPASGGGSSSFLRADGAWAAPLGSPALPFAGAVVTPTSISATTNDWDIFGGNSAAALVRASTTGAAQDITGITGGSAGRVCVIFNVGTTGTLNFLRDNAGSSAGNRLAVPSGGGSFGVQPGSGGFFWYDGIDSRWRTVE